jgi:hypothetical protein
MYMYIKDSPAGSAALTMCVKETAPAPRDTIAPLASTSTGSDGDPTAQSDLYRLGSLLFECLVGSARHIPPEGHDRTQGSSLFALRPDTPPGLGRVVERCLSAAGSERLC